MDINSILEKILVANNKVPAERMEKLRELINADKGLADVLVEQKIIDEDAVVDIVAEHFGVTGINLNHYAPENDVITLIPMALCEKYKMFPLFKIKNTLMVATADPADVHAMDEVRVKSGYGVEPVFALSSSIMQALNRFYSVDDSVTDMMGEIKDEELDESKMADERELAEAASDEPVVKLVNLFIVQAVRERASDIHINPERDIIRVRFRVDGILQEVAQPPKKFQAALISRLKILANLDIAERRVPQDGRIEIKVDNRVIDMRISTFPTVYGENVVMRILDKSSVLLTLEDLGFSKRDHEKFNRMIYKPYGIILTSGPTGSGKTTTLYAALNTINSVDKNIITLEDPVEYELKLIRQAQVNPRAGFTFAGGLRAILRQDPDVILVGEIRDLETAAIAVQAAMTGHLVLSTLHTNDAPGCITRLVDMGIQDFLLSSTLIATLAQRLVRTICPSCKEEYKPEQYLIDDVIGAAKTDMLYYKEVVGDSIAAMRYFRGRGCQDCRQSGYKGRLGLYEIMEVTPRLQDAITHKAPDAEIRKIAREEGMRSLREDGIEKIRQGKTTIEEVVRVTKLL